jgi:hypothetical protein
MPIIDSCQIRAKLNLVRSAEKLQDVDIRPDTEECSNQTDNQLW